MRIVGRDYIFKILNGEYLESVFDRRKKYFASGRPQELGRNSTIFFVMRNPKTKEYNLVGEAKPTFVGPLLAKSNDESNFTEERNWRFVIDLVDIQKYHVMILASEIFSPDAVRKLYTQRPFGIQLSSQEGRSAKEKIQKIVSNLAPQV